VLSGNLLKTDAPIDHDGKGENFAPTDLLATALGTCFLTVMGITAKHKGWKLGEMSIEVTKTMTSEGPRKIKAIALQIAMPADLSPEQLKVLQGATRDCPVLRNLEGSINVIVNWTSKKRSSQISLSFLPIKVFRETPKVTFFEAGVTGSNGSDVVIHKGRAISPPNDEDYEQYYVHTHQIDHNLVLEGKRTFTLLNPEWDEPHHVIYLNQKMGALQIPIGTYHRSVSGSKGSMVLNQAVRDENFDASKEFVPVSLRERPDLKAAKAVDPVYWIWEAGHIKRTNVNSLLVTTQ
tara:strand:+ start:359 stop:1237 length:879 start_codon:yes stop_codon:yes gene_type:complete